MLANLHQDMTGAKQSLGSRVQHLIFAPHSITTYLDALFESIGNYVIFSNNPFITSGRMGDFARQMVTGFIIVAAVVIDTYRAKLLMTFQYSS